MNENDSFAYMRGAPWMNRKLSLPGRAAAFLRRELEDFPAIEGRDPNHADLDAIVKRTVDYMMPIFRRERAMEGTPSTSVLAVVAPGVPHPEPPAPDPGVIMPPPYSPLAPMLPIPPPMDFDRLPEPTPDPKDKVPPSRYPGQNIG